MKPLYYDIRHLIRVFDSCGAARTGIFRVELDILEELLRSDLNLKLFCDIKDMSKVPFLESYLGIEREGYYQYVSNANDIECGVFFSPIFSPPTEIIQNRSITKALMVHDVIPLKMNAYSHVAKEGTWFHSVIQSIYNKDVHVFVPSEVTRADLIGLGVDQYRITVCPHGLNISTDKSFDSLCTTLRKRYLSFKYNYAEKDYFFSLGSIHPHKNLLRQLLAFEKILEQGKDVIFVFAGAATKTSSNYLNKVFEIVDRNPDNIFYLGYVDDADVMSFYANALALVFTSEYEGFGFPALDAMRVGCPVITSERSSMEEIVGQAGILIDYQNLQEHVDAYNFCLEPTLGMHDMVEQAYMRSLQFSYSTNLIRSLEALLE